MNIFIFYEENTQTQGLFQKPILIFLGADNSSELSNPRFPIPILPQKLDLKPDPWPENLNRNPDPIFSDREPNPVYQLQYKILLICQNIQQQNFAFQNIQA